MNNKNSARPHTLLCGNPSLKRGVTRASFHLVGKQALTIDKLINLVNGCTKTGETSFKTFTLISSAPLAFHEDKLSIKFSFLLYCYDRNIELSDKIING